MEKVSASISVADNYTDSIKTYPYEGGMEGRLSLSISGTWTGTVTLQRSPDDGTTWYNVDTWTSNTEETVNDPNTVNDYRVGVESGNLDSGTADVMLYRPA